MGSMSRLVFGSSGTEEEQHPGESTAEEFDQAVDRMTLHFEVEFTRPPGEPGEGEEDEEEHEEADGGDGG